MTTFAILNISSVGYDSSLYYLVTNLKKKILESSNSAVVYLTYVSCNHSQSRHLPTRKSNWEDLKEVLR